MPRSHLPAAGPGAHNPLPRYAQRFVQRRVARALVERFRARLFGAENVPREGGAVLVCQRSRWGLDPVALGALLWLETDRVPRLLDERSIPGVPSAWRALAAMGVAAAACDDPVSALRAGELLCVFPAGDDVLFRPHGEVSALRWGARTGFARFALLAGVPVVPVLALGADELWDRGHAPPGVPARVPAGSPRWESPALRELRPRRARIDFCVLDPLRAGGEARDPAAVERLRRHTYDALQGELARVRAPRRTTNQLDDLRARRGGRRS